MAKEKKQTKEDGPAEVGEWIVTFSDCMTLLLCFFVMLLTFSSFDEQSLQRFGGAFVSDQLRPGIENKPKPMDSIIEPQQSPDAAPQGSELPTNRQEPETHQAPRSLNLPGQDTYSDRKIIHIPSSHLFRGSGSDLSAAGRRTLNIMAEFLAQMPCRVVISESTRRWTTKRGIVIGRRAGLNRAWAVVAHLTSTRGDAPGLSQDQFSVSTFQQASVASSSSGQDLKVVEVVMLSGRAHR